MPFEIKFTAETPSDAIAQMRNWINLAVHMRNWLNDLEGVANVPTAPVEPVPASGGTKRAGRKPAEPEAAAQIDLEEAIAAAPVKKPAPPVEPEKPVSKDDLRRKLIELMHSKGENAPTDLLQTQFSVSKIGELDPAQYARCVRYADEILTGE